jgi:hypothetical protein
MAWPLAFIEERDAWARYVESGGERRHRRQGGSACRDGDFVQMTPLAPHNVPVLPILPFRAGRLALIRAIPKAERAICWPAYAIRVAPKAT